jgi:serine/threonine protein kinase/tetratricopeptide (TPR) repeat protein
MIGRILSHYKALEEISRGGMGIVYRALDLNLDREVALKVLPPELVADSERKRRFVQEAKAAAKLEHPNIAVVYEIDESEGETFVVMELIHGEKLRDTLQRRRLPLDRSLELAAEIAEGLSCAHEKGIVHRDLKPANVMVTEQGHAKIIDFGLAKLLEPLGKQGSEVSTALREETSSGKVMGTVSYMSPEQARGEKVDHRSDIFSFGIVVYEMLTGEPPFRGQSGIETLNAILNQPTPKVGGLRSGVPAEVSYELEHLIEKCLAKDPKKRYQTIEDVVLDLKSARRHLESGSHEPVARRGGNLWIFAVAAGLIALLIVGWLVFEPQPSPKEKATTAESSKPSIAVLLFDNINQDPDIDWMRLGLAEMLVTDLSLSPHIDVVPTDRIYRILDELDSLDESVSSLEIVQEVAERANVETVLLGSYMRAGETIRINIRVQEADSGKILSTERVEAVGETDIFSKVDDLTRRIRASFDVPTIAGVPRLEEVTTSSPEAYRYFVEGQRLRQDTREEESLPLLERAIELDPNFATAIYSLASAHWNLGHDKQSEALAEQALKLRRLPEIERNSLEARLYSFREEDIGKALEAFERLRELGVARGWNNAAVRYRFLERYDEAIALMEDLLIRRGRLDFNQYGTFTNALISQGEYERAYELLQNVVTENPESAVPHQLLGNVFIWWGKLDEAIEAHKKAESLIPGIPQVQYGRWWIFVLRDQWEDGAAAVKKLTASQDTRWKWRGWTNDALLMLHRGQSESALASLDRAMEAPAEPGRLSGLSHSLASHVLLEIGQLSQSLDRARQAQNEGRGNIAEWEGLFFEGVAHAKSVRVEAASEAAEKLRERTTSIPSEKEKRRHHHLMGEIARIRGHSKVAIEELEKARSMLMPHGHGGQGSRHWIGAQPDVPIWYSLASAYLEAGDTEKAAEWFWKITESTVERVEWPILYVRSFYFLGKIHENRGDMEEAREYYSRFYDYWQDGDMDRERVEEARSKIS